jgi:hypothetical protein
MNIGSLFCDSLVRSGEYQASSFIFVCLARFSLFEDRGVVRCDIGWRNALHSVHEHEMFKGVGTEIMLSDRRSDLLECNVFIRGCVYV